MQPLSTFEYRAPETINSTSCWTIFVTDEVELNGVSTSTLLRELLSHAGGSPTSTSESGDLNDQQTEQAVEWWPGCKIW